MYVALEVAKSIGVVTIDRQNVLNRHWRKRVSTSAHPHTHTRPFYCTRVRSISCVRNSGFSMVRYLRECDLKCNQIFESPGFIGTYFYRTVHRISNNILTNVTIRFKARNDVSEICLCPNAQLFGYLTIME